jgi:hypothetical protein
MNTSAATQLRSGTRRGTPPRGRGGGAWSSGWMRCHSASGRSRSTRLVMTGAIPRRPRTAQLAQRAGLGRHGKERLASASLPVFPQQGIDQAVSPGAVAEGDLAQDALASEADAIKRLLLGDVIRIGAGLQRWTVVNRNR